VPNPLVQLNYANDYQSVYYQITNVKITDVGDVNEGQSYGSAQYQLPGILEMERG